MPTPLLEVTVQPNWRDIERQAETQRLQLWRAVQAAVALATLTALLARLLLPAWPWHGLLHMALFTGISWLLPLATVMEASRRPTPLWPTLLASALLLAAATLLLYTTAPNPLDANPLAGSLGNLPFLALLVPIIAWSLLAYAGRRFPRGMRGLGFVSRQLWLNLLIGAAAGTALGLYFLLSATFLPGPAPGAAGPAAAGLLVWTFCYQAGLQAPGEEMLFRGLAYRLQFPPTTRNTLLPALWIVGLNTLLYLVPASRLPSPLAAAWLLLAGAALATFTTFLRHRQQSLWPALAANVVFGLFLAVALAA